MNISEFMHFSIDKHIGWYSLEFQQKTDGTLMLGYRGGFNKGIVNDYVGQVSE